VIDRLLLTPCDRHNQPLSDTEQYIEKISSLDERYELFMELKLYRKAADVAHRLKDASKLQEVLSAPRQEQQLDFMLSFRDAGRQNMQGSNVRATNSRLPVEDVDMRCCFTDESELKQSAS